MCNLLTSFQKLAQLVDQPRVAWRVVLGLLAVHTGLLMYSAYVHSPTLNEPGHLVAGLSHWKFGRFELYRVNPPLVRMVAALPVMAVGYEEDWTGFYEGPGARPVFGMGDDFVASNGPRTLFLLMIARWTCIPFSWLGGIVCYLWGRDLYSRPAGLVACFIWCFEPNILAHASLITADAHATALALAACYAFWRWLKKPTWTQAALTGVVLGLAELAKTTFILFYPLWPLMWLAYRWGGRASTSARVWTREAAMLALRMGIGLYIVNLGYGFEGSFTPLGDFHFVSRLFVGERNEHMYPQERAGGGSIEVTTSEALSDNRFEHSCLSALPIPFPVSYLVGIDIQQRDFENYGRLSFLCGEWRDHGWWYYYLYAALVKVPLGLWLLGLWAIRSVRDTAFRDRLFLLAPAFVVFGIASSKTGLNEHFRYVLPAFPFLFVWVSGAIPRQVQMNAGKTLDHSNLLSPINSSTWGIGSRLLGWIATTSLLVWFGMSTLWVFPHSLSYFNESIGGPLNGADYLRGSNLDWGQDICAAAQSLDECDKTPAYIMLSCFYHPSDLADRLACCHVRNREPEVILVSVNAVRSADWIGFEDGERSQAVIRSTRAALDEGGTVGGYSLRLTLAAQEVDAEGG